MMSFTKETLIGNMVNKKDEAIKGILTSEEAFKRSKQTKNLMVYVSDYEKIFFFSDSNRIYQDTLPDHIAICIMHFPRYGIPTTHIHNGFIDTIKKFVMVFYYDYHQIKTMRELLNYLNE